MAIIESAEFIATVSCHDQENPFVCLTLKEPTDPTANVFANLLRHKAHPTPETTEEQPDSGFPAGHEEAMEPEGKEEGLARRPYSVRCFLNRRRTRWKQIGPYLTIVKCINTRGQICRGPYGCDSCNEWL